MDHYDEKLFDLHIESKVCNAIEVVHTLQAFCFML